MGKSVANGTYPVMKSGNVCLGKLENNTCSDEMIVEVNGEVPTTGTITITGGTISEVGLEYQDKYIVKDDKDNLVYGTKPKTYYANGEEVYYNVTTGEVCDESQAVSTTGTKSGCMKFYAFNDVDGNETVNLILDHNTTAVVVWNSSGSTVNGPGEVLTQLYNDTKDWKETITPEDYTMDQSTQLSAANYTVKYSETPSIEGATEPYKARLITAQEIAQITGADIALNWDETKQNYVILYIDGPNETTSGDYGWLYDRTSLSCTQYGCLNNADVETYGYWTVSSAAVYSGTAFCVDHHGYVDGGNADYDDFDDPGDPVGVRPVITILKSNLS